MATPASIAGHPLHAILVAVPIGLWVFSFACDVIGIVTGGPDWFEIAYLTLIGGLIGALIAVVPGAIDFGHVRTRHGPRARRVVVVHMALNLLVIAVVAANIYLRTTSDMVELPTALSVISLLLLAASGWFGGELVHVLGVTVREPGPGPGASTQDPAKPRQAKPRQSKPRPPHR
jgi:uncharacterized membrane protein